MLTSSVWTGGFFCTSCISAVNALALLSPKARVAFMYFQVPRAQPKKSSPLKIASIEASCEQDSGHAIRHSKLSKLRFQGREPEQQHYCTPPKAERWPRPQLSTALQKLLGLLWHLYSRKLGTRRCPDQRDKQQLGEAHDGLNLAVSWKDTAKNARVKQTLAGCASRDSRWRLCSLELDSCPSDSASS